MNRLIAILLFASLLAIAAPPPFLGYVYPAGGQRGTTLWVLVGGQRMSPRCAIISSNPGITLKAVHPVPGGISVNIPQVQRKWLVQWFKGIANGDSTPPPRPELNEDQAAEWRANVWMDHLDTLTEWERSIVAHDITIRPNALQATPSLNQRMLLQFEILPGAPLGRSTIRLAGPTGISNERIFYVDDAPQLQEPHYAPPFLKRAPYPDITDLPAVVNGQILPGEADAYNIDLKGGTPYTFAVCASELSPYLGDTVPGHFQPIIRILNARGREVAFADDAYHRPDPILHFTPKASGRYRLVITDALARGRADFVYRVSCTPGTIPYAPFYNFADYLPAPRQHLATDLGDTPFPTDAATDIRGVLEKAPASEFRFQATAGQRLVCEVFARRMDSPLDSVLAIFGPDGKKLAENDDPPPPKLNLDRCRQHIDSCLAFTAPADGIYTIRLFDRTGTHGPDHRYILQVRPPTPAAFVFTSISAPNLDKGNTITFTFHALRKDGCKAPITLVCPGLTSDKPAVIPADKDEATLTFRAPFRYRRYPVWTPLPFTASCPNPKGGTAIAVPVIPADEAMQAFAYTHLVAARQILAPADIAPPRPRPQPQRLAKPAAAPAKPAAAPATSSPA
jgi:hypothetical protein